MVIVTKRSTKHDFPTKHVDFQWNDKTAICRVSLSPMSSDYDPSSESSSDDEESVRGEYSMCSARRWQSCITSASSVAIPWSAKKRSREGR